MGMTYSKEDKEYNDAYVRYTYHEAYKSRVYTRYNEFFEDIRCDVYVSAFYIEILHYRS